MTVGSPGKMILQFTFPLFIGNVFQQLYNMADTIIVGKFVGANALAAVGSTGTIMFLIIGFKSNAKNSRFSGHFISDCLCNYDGSQYAWNEISTAFVKYSERYFSGRIFIYYGDLRRDFCTGII